MHIYHYTTGDVFASIMASGVLRANKDGMLPGEKPALWFTISLEWEQTANKRWRAEHNGKDVIVDLDQAFTHELAGGLVRLLVDEQRAPYRWKQFRELSGCPTKMVRGLYLSAVRSGSKLADWRFTFDDIPCEAFESVEFFNGASWVNDYRHESATIERRQEVLELQIRKGRFLPLEVVKRTGQLSYAD